MKNILRPLTSVAFVLLIMAAIVYFGFVGTHEREPGRPDIDRMTVGYIPINHALPLYIAIERGLFAEENIQVELIPLPGGPKILEVLMAGEVDVGFSNVVSVIMARRNGIAMSPITGGAIETKDNKDHAILVKADSPVASPFDLKGKRIAINSRQNIDHLMMRAYLDKYDLTEDDVNLIEIPFPRMSTALEGGLTDAIATVEPFVTIGTREYRQRILEYNYVAVRDRTFVATFAAMDERLAEDPALFERFSRAIGRASEMGNRDPALSRSVLPTYTKITPSLAEVIEMPYFSPSPDRANLAETEKMMVARGFVE